MLTVIAHFWTLPGKEAEMKAVLLEARETYLKDKGLVSYYAMQDAKDPTAWSIIERFEDEAALGIHLANPYFKKFGADTAPIFDPARPVQLLTHNEI
ncbi:hypothetical protein FB45DRAFT_730891 [Roridomyces roridus]|uniref:ABM domain-containing protein n=1 Tax=Roridomyces roridus TaxID=1738132 RepID=A0AAD7FYI2_9AGAR|nr:hypothetical protein FB45DRAFT_730891 [Roridomyces roridus]